METNTLLFTFVICILIKHFVPKTIEIRLSKILFLTHTAKSLESYSIGSKRWITRREKKYLIRYVIGGQLLIAYGRT